MNTKKNNQCTSHGENKYTRIMMKSNYKNTQNKLQEDYVNWFIELIKKRYLKTISFPKISNDFLFLLILNKQEWFFHNFKIMEFVRLIHAKSIGFWWGPHIWVFFFLLSIAMLNKYYLIFVLLFDIHVIILYLN